MQRLVITPFRVNPNIFSIGFIVDPQRGSLLKIQRIVKVQKQVYIGLALERKEDPIHKRSILWSMVRSSAGTESPARKIYIVRVELL